MNNFIYETPTKVYFGRGEADHVGAALREFAPKKVLILYGGASAEKSGLLARVERQLTEEGIAYVAFGGIHANPALDKVREGIALCLAEGVDFVLAVGGGSVLDTAKDIANGAANPETDVWDFSLGKAQPKKTLRKGCVLTLSAAGSEMSNSCVITNEATGDKRGYGSPKNRFDFAIEDPTLTFSVSPYQTACGAVDIAMHTIERFFNVGEDTYLTDALAIGVLRSVRKAGDDCLADPENYEARANMMWASSLAHNGLTQCGRDFELTVHQFEHEVSGLYPSIAHGAGLAALWCSWARYVYSANVPRFVQYFHEVWDLPVDYEHPEKTVEEGIDLQEAYYKRIGMPTTLAELGVQEEDLELLADKCSRGKTRSLKGYKPLPYEDILAVYRMALHGSKKPLPPKEDYPFRRPRTDTPMLCVYAGPDFFRKQREKNEGKREA